MSFSEDSALHSISFSAYEKSWMVICTSHSAVAVDLTQVEKREYLFSSLVQTSFVDIIDCSSFSENELIIGATLGQHRAVQCITSTQQVLFSLTG